MGFFDLLEFIRKSPELLDFIDNQLSVIIFFTLGIGFLVLLIETRLPLRYYWNLPIYSFKRILENLPLVTKTPVWGYCIEADTSKILPLTAVELLDEATKGISSLAYSNHLGQYGFKAPPGKYILRGIKNEYLMPSVLDPENIELVEIKESYASPIAIKGGHQPPQLNITLLPLEKFNPKDIKFQVQHYIKTFIFQFANALLILSIISAFTAWAPTRNPLYLLLTFIGINFLFIKLYILETVAKAAKTVE